MPVLGRDLKEKVINVKVVCRQAALASPKP